MGYVDSLDSIHSRSVEEVKRTVENEGFTPNQALLAASCKVIELHAGVEAAKHVGRLPHATGLGFQDEWQVRNIIDVFPGLEICDLRSLAATLVVYYADAVKEVAMELHEKSQLETKELLTAAVNGFGPEFPVHPRVRWALEVGPYGAGLD